MTTPLHSALADLKQRREKLDVAIAAIEDLLTVTPAPPSVSPKAVRPRPAAIRTGNGHDHSVSSNDAILTQLKGKGWAKPRDVAKALDLNLAALRYHLKPLVKAKSVIAMGGTSARRIALAGTPPPKEAP